VPVGHEAGDPQTDIERSQVRPSDASTVLSVVIPTYNRRGNLTRVVQPLLDDPSTGEVIVVVDGARDGSLELLEEWSSREPRLRAMFQENAGEGVARQRGVEAARFEVVVLLDDDVVADPGLVSGHARHHTGDEDLVVVGYMQTKVPVPRMPGQAATFLYADDYEKQCAGYEADPDSILVFLWMGNLSMRRSSALRVGIQSAIRFSRHEDMDFGLRCRRAGMTAAFDRSLAAEHVFARTLRRFASDFRDSGASRRLLMREHPEVAQYIDPMHGRRAYVRVGCAVLSSRLVRPVSTRLMIAAAEGAGRLRMWSVETLCARVLRKIEVQYGFAHSASA
jgi:glycosyltransferase involved in cell wall biosynthesis